MVIVAAIHRKLAHVRAEVKGRHKLTLPGRHQKPELVEHGFERMPGAVLPCEHSLCGVAPAKKMDRGARMGPAKLAGDFEEQAALGDQHSILAARRFQHSDPILDLGAIEILVWIRAGDHTYHFVDECQAGLDQRQMRASQRIESPREDSNRSRTGG